MVNTIYAQNLGVYGTIYQIAEPDLLSFIHERLMTFKQDGRLKEMENGFINKVKEKALHPTPVTDVHSAKHNNTFYYTPSFTLNRNVYDANGNILFRAGVSINPLDQKTISKIAPDTYVPQFNETLLFINADNTDQVKWAESEIQNLKRNNSLFKVILVQGNLKTASQALGRIYFDQDGVLCHQFKIRAVPAIVTRAGVRLKIEEKALPNK